MNPIRSLRLGTLVLVAVAARPGLAVAQDLGPLVAQCVTSGAGAARCTEAALALKVLKGGVTLLNAGGSDVVGTASTLGMRIGAVPRISFNVRLVTARLKAPDVLSGEAPAAENAFYAKSVQIQGVVGVFNGLSIAPTVGGFGSLDLMASASLAFLPTDEGFEESRGSFGIGARVGILRESFTLPGITVSVMHRDGGTVRVGDIATGDPTELAWDMRSTSLRATVGKTFFGLGLLAGYGSDWSVGDVSLTVNDSGTGSTGTAASDDFTVRRNVYFGGASMTFLIAQVSFEVGWADAFDSIPGRSGGFDTSTNSYFGTLGFRITF